MAMQMLPRIQTAEPASNHTAATYKESLAKRPQAPHAKQYNRF